MDINNEIAALEIASKKLFKKISAVSHEEAYAAYKTDKVEEYLEGNQRLHLLALSKCIDIENAIDELKKFIS